MLSSKERLGPRHALPGDPYPSHLPSFEITTDYFGPFPRHLHETREGAPIDLFRFEIAPDLFGSTYHRLLDAFEEEEEEEAVVLAEKKQRGFLESGDTA